MYALLGKNEDGESLPAKELNGLLAQEYKRDHLDKTIDRLIELQGLIENGDIELDNSWLKCEMIRRDPTVAYNHGACIEYKLKIEIEAKGLAEEDQDNKIVDTEVVSGPDDTVAKDYPSSSSGSSSGPGNSGGTDDSSPGNDKKVVEPPSSETASEVDHSDKGSDSAGDLVQHENVAAAPVTEKPPAIRIVIKKGSLPNLERDIELFLVNVQELAQGCKGIATYPELRPTNLHWIYQLSDKRGHPELECGGIKVRDVELVPVMRVKDRTILKNAENVGH